MCLVGGDMMKYPERKSMRLKDYDYGQNGAYFITICTYNRRCIFGDPVGAALCGRLQETSKARTLIEYWLLEIDKKYPDVRIDKYVIMPNHIHAIIIIVGGHAGPPLPGIIDWFKTMTTNAYINGVKNKALPPFDKHIWQRGYYEHVIRNEQDYLDIWQYIENNPAKWAEDEYNTP
jgi:putative transposase